MSRKKDEPEIALKFLCGKYISQKYQDRAGRGVPQRDPLQKSRAVLSLNSVLSLDNTRLSVIARHFKRAAHANVPNLRAAATRHGGTLGFVSFD